MMKKNYFLKGKKKRKLTRSKLAPGYVTGKAIPRECNKPFPPFSPPRSRSGNFPSSTRTTPRSANFYTRSKLEAKGVPLGYLEFSHEFRGKPCPHAREPPPHAPSRCEPGSFRRAAPDSFWTARTGHSYWVWAQPDPTWCAPCPFLETGGYLQRTVLSVSVCQNSCDSSFWTVATAPSNCRSWAL